MRTLLLAFGLLGCLASPAPLAPAPGSPAGCPRVESGRALDTPCPSGTRCVDTGAAGVACLRGCAADDDCPAPGCCQSLVGASEGACAAPAGGDRSVCRGASAATRAAFEGVYAGRSRVTWTPDGGAAGATHEFDGHRLQITPAGVLGLWVVFDGPCGAEAQVEAGRLQLLPQPACASVTLWAGASLTLVAGAATRAGTSLAVDASFRATAPTGAAGTLAWSFRGAR